MSWSSRLKYYKETYNIFAFKSARVEFYYDYASGYFIYNDISCPSKYIQFLPNI